MGRLPCFYFGMSASRNRFIVVVIAAAALFAVADLLMLSHSWVEVDPSGFIILAKTLALVTAIYGLGWIVTFRLRSDRSRLALGMKRYSESLKTLSQALALFLPLSFLDCLFMYLATATNKPLVDSNIAAIDSALGFDWLAVVQALNSSPIMASILMFAYTAIGLLMIGLLFLLALSSETDALMEFIALIAVSSAFTGFLMMAFPTAGAYAFYAPPHDAYSNFTGMGGLTHLQTLGALRSGSPFVFHINKVVGLVSFPSFHCALGIIMTYSCRRTYWLLVPVGVLVTIMIPATIPEGGHHLADAIAGILIGLASIGIVSAVSTRRRPAATLVTEG
ncbi:phosphatase PAP2 family protein [Mesorhizobium sp. B1-1-7]|uniref:phosphatase PAP2 family protein n=1 Tax=Mesorhizobium sp. B1-1-7 TaxID=2589977 RepID=UPI001FEFA309|nr:phosphatase PAP2 family protein [Mesorhizobium sp. B1-1-7]